MSVIFNDWAIRKWSMVLGDDFALDKATFLLCSIIPLSYIEISDNENLVLVDLAEIRKYTNVVKEGCDFLVSNGYAKWVVTNSKDPNKAHDKIAIGTSPNFVRCVYYFEKSKIVSASVSKIVETPNNQTYDFSETIDKLDVMMENYKKYCTKIKLHSKPDKLFKKIKQALTKAQTGSLTISEFMGYLDSVNAMVYEWTDVPNTYTNPKENAVAKKVLGMTTPDKLIKVVPYFVENYPNWAKPGYESVNIYTFSMHFQTALMKMNGATGKRKTPKTYTDDKL
jgi:hypothetical protein